MLSMIIWVKYYECLWVEIKHEWNSFGETFVYTTCCTLYIYICSYVYHIEQQLFIMYLVLLSIYENVDSSTLYYINNLIYVSLIISSYNYRKIITVGFLVVNVSLYFKKVFFYIKLILFKEVSTSH